MNDALAHRHDLGRADARERRTFSASAKAGVWFSVIATAFSGCLISPKDYPLEGPTRAVGAGGAAAGIGGTDELGGEAGTTSGGGGNAGRGGHGGLGNDGGASGESNEAGAAGEEGRAGKGGSTTGGAGNMGGSSGGGAGGSGDAGSGGPTSGGAAGTAGGCGDGCSSPTPHCVLTAANYACQARIELANEVDGEVAGDALTLTHSLQAGANRLILVAIAAESGDNRIAGARPDIVTYGGTAMTPGPEQEGVGHFWSPDQFVFFLVESGITSKTGDQTVTIASNAAPDPQAIIANVVQLNGVDQAVPIAGFAGGFLGTVAMPQSPSPSVISHAVTVSTSGSVVYSFASAEYTVSLNCPDDSTSGCPTSNVSPSGGLTRTRLLSSPEVVGGGAQLRAFGALVSGTSASSPAPGSLTPSWSFPYSGRTTHLAVVISPAQGS